MNSGTSPLRLRTPPVRATSSLSDTGSTRGGVMRRDLSLPDCVDVAKRKYRLVHKDELCPYCRARYGHGAKCRGLTVRRRRKHHAKFQ